MARSGAAGLAGRGQVRSAVVRYGATRQVRAGTAWCAVVQCGVGWFGKARQGTGGMVRQDKVRSGAAGLVRCVRAEQGVLRSGRYGKS